MSSFSDAPASTSDETEDEGWKKLLHKGRRKVSNSDMRSRRHIVPPDWERQQNDIEDEIGYDFRNIVEMRVVDGDIVTVPPIQQRGGQRTRKQKINNPMRLKTVYDLPF